MRHSHVALAYTAVLFASAAALATTLPKKAPSDLCREADRIFVARVVSTESAWDNGDHEIWTTVEFEVERGIQRATEGDRISLRFLGGTAIVPGAGCLTEEVPGVPTFRPGERVLLFANDDPRFWCPLVGWCQGAFVVATDPRTGKDAVFDADGTPVEGLDEGGVRVARGSRPMALDGFLAALGQAKSAAVPIAARDAAPPEVIVICPDDRRGSEAPTARCAPAPPQTTQPLLGYLFLGLGLCTCGASWVLRRNGGVR